MQIMSRAEFKGLAKEYPYYRKRWHYFKKVIDILQETSFKSCLELGPYKRPIVHGCDAIDIRKHLDNLTYRHDATKIPWPIDDAKYDLFIALQVWEHLDNKQTRAFREVMRISRMAVLSFPYMWDWPKDSGNYPLHHLIDKELIEDWTLNVKPEKVIEVPRTGKRLTLGPKLIYLWKF